MPVWRPATADAGRNLERRVVAEVGPEVIYDREVIEAADRIFVSQPSQDPLADRKRLLEPMIEAKLLVAEAEALELETPAMRRQLRKFENDRMIMELEKVEIRDKIVVSPAAVDELVARQQHFLHMTEILAADQASALAVLDSLEAGADFRDLVRAVSIDTTHAGGVLPPLTWGMAPANLMEVAYALDPGDVGGPIATPQGWHVVRLDSVTARAIDQDKVREEAEKSLRTAEFNRGQREFLARMEQELDYTVIDSVVAAFTAQMAAWVDAGATDQTAADGSRDRFGFTPAEHRQAVFTYDGHAFTIGDYTDYMTDSNVELVKQRVTRERVLRDLEQYFRHRAYADLARARGYLEATGFDLEVRRQREKMLILALHLRLVALPAPPPPEALHEYYDTHRQRYRQPPFTQVTQIIADDAIAPTLEQTLEAGMSLDAALALAAGRGAPPRHREGVVIEQGSEAYASVEGLAPGQVAMLGVDPQGQRLLLLVESVHPGALQEFEEAAEQVLKDTTVQQEEVRYNQLIERLKAKYPIVIHDDELLRLPL